MDQLKKKLTQFGQSLGLIQETLTRKDEEEKERIIDKKISELKQNTQGERVSWVNPKVQKPIKLANEFEAEYLRLVCENTY